MVLKETCSWARVGLFRILTSSIHKPENLTTEKMQYQYYVSAPQSPDVQAEPLFCHVIFDFDGSEDARFRISLSGSTDPLPHSHTLAGSADPDESLVKFLELGYEFAARCPEGLVEFARIKSSLLDTPIPDTMAFFPSATSQKCECKTSAELFDQVNAMRSRVGHGVRFERIPSLDKLVDTAVTQKAYEIVLV